MCAAWPILVLLTLRVPNQDSVPVSSPTSAPGWRTTFVDNAKLPPGFRQFAIQRADGTRMTAFLAGDDVSRTKRKPLLVFLDGSGAQSLFTILPQGTSVGLFGLLARQAGEAYHVAACEKRGAEFGVLGMPGSGESAAEEYNRYATFPDRVAEVRLLLDALLGEPLVDPQRVVLVGISEGAVVAAGVAASEPRVTHVAFLCGNGPTQLFDLVTLRRKALAKEGRSPEEIDAAVRELEAEFRAILAEPESTTRYFMGHAYRRWSTFCQNPPLETLRRSRAKLFLAHGTEDASVPIESFDLLVLELLRVGRADVTARRYVGRDHSLRDPRAEAAGTPLRDVFGEILAWAEQ